MKSSMTQQTGARHARIPSPVGELLLLATDEALTGLYLGDPEGPLPPAAAPEHPIVAQARRELHEYFTGARRDFEVPILLAGTGFQREVWAALRALPFGTTTTYGALAEALGRPRAVRAVGAANALNPVSIIVPCHRVIGADGGLRGYAWGMERKRWLLAHEYRGGPGAGLFADQAC